MYLCSFLHNGQEKYGALTANQQQVIDIKEAEQALFHSKELPASLNEALSAPSSQRRLEEVFEQANNAGANVLSLNEVTLLAPIQRPNKNIICLGINYREHAYEFEGTTEDDKAIPKQPIVFSKLPTSVAAPEQGILSHSTVTSELDYEGELAIIIGKEGTYIPKEEAYDYIYGYTIINDVTARDLQRNHKQWLLGKGLDTHCPMGPFLVTSDEIPNPQKLDIETRVNGEVRQKSNTELLIFDIPTIIETLSKGITLQPGDIIATGTPKGVGLGFDPPKFLKDGDIVEVEIERIGVLRNEIVPARVSKETKIEIN
ncbi:fumarylacetoacetate hydrolase family protein [Bacillus thermotolerans]|uniref:Fumarylacetoacetate hydrolase family protein n=1 Tax=Bacillus thermotolerans TaxID=1221996 RepID=A0A0F5HJQ8_BACTR|nr:fumarylacetoacetate hydrolase family protein [Bacillus thermotolerans]KKB33619.1 Fumarylacetoacetate hydrolase family protein [Bacillus thermotolerans]KKB41769.1 Fumarylacetoacetate hydrolase family protein [Bacillus thermotolerans]KKB44339.1 Fumarylacetoacetate hydrolase family protein [Bacillus thermotolerans]